MLHRENRSLSDPSNLISNDTWQEFWITPFLDTNNDNSLFINDQPQTSISKQFWFNKFGYDDRYFAREKPRDFDSFVDNCRGGILAEEMVGKFIYLFRRI